MSNNYRIAEFAKRIGRSVQTVRRGEAEGKLIAKRLPSGQRYFDESDVKAMMGGAPARRDVVVYCRVSSAGQKDDLASQVAAMQTYCLGEPLRLTNGSRKLMAIVHTFSCRLYGMHKYKHSLKADFPEFQLGTSKDELQ